MSDIVNSILGAVDTMVDARLRERGTTVYHMGMIREVHEMGHTCIVETPTGKFQVGIPREFDGVEEGLMVVFKDVFGDHQRLYIDSIVSGDWSGGGGATGSGRSGFRVVQHDGEMEHVISL